MVQQKKAINLLPKEALEHTPIGKFLKWALTFGRYIVIFTELIVIVAFLFRFKLDRDLINLQTEIKKNQSIIDSLSELEANVNHVHQQLAFIKKEENEKINSFSLLEELTKHTPLDVVFSNLNLSQKSITIEGISYSKNGLNTFLYGLQSSDVFSDINLESIVSKGNVNPTIKFTLSAKIITKQDKKGK